MARVGALAAARVIQLAARVAGTAVAAGMAEVMEVGVEAETERVALREGRWAAPLVAHLAVLWGVRTAPAGEEESEVAAVAAKAAAESSAVVSAVAAQVAAAASGARQMGWLVETEVGAGLGAVTAVSCSHHTYRSSRLDTAAASVHARHRSHQVGKACISRFRAHSGTCQMGS